MSESAKKAGRDVPMLTRLMYAAAADVPLLLAVQYRMAPQISAYPNEYIYGGAISDGPDVARRGDQVTGTCMYPHACLYACLCTCPYTCLYTCSHTIPYTCPYTSICTCIHACLYTCICTGVGMCMDMLYRHGHGHV